MIIDFGFSYIGLSFLLLLIIPNIVWSRHQPKNYIQYAKQEKISLRILERVGEVAISCLLVICKNFNIYQFSMKIIFLLLAYICMIFYEICWIRYFKSKQTMFHFYYPFLGMPIPLAILPIGSFVMLSLYGNNIYFMIATLLFGIGHIGIHLQHYQQIKNKENIQ